MNNYVSTEKSLKRWLKSRVKITMATVVGFLIAGTVTFGATYDGDYTNKDLYELGSSKFVTGKTEEAKALNPQFLAISLISFNSTPNLVSGLSEPNLSIASIHSILGNS